MIADAYCHVWRRLGLSDVTIFITVSFFIKKNMISDYIATCRQPVPVCKCLQMSRHGNVVLSDYAECFPQI